MQKNIQSISRTTLIANTLANAGKSLTIQELSSILQIPIPKLRNTLTNYHNTVVRVGNSLYDLRARAYKGKKLRIRPSKTDLAKGTLSLSEEEYLYFDGLSLKFNVSSITLHANHESIIANIHRMKRSLLNSQLSSLGPWYKKVGFALGDDIIFSCQNIETFEFSICYIPHEERDESVIKIANKILADAAYAALNYEIPRYGSDMFMIRNYSFLINPPTSPDPMNEVLANDPRFVNNFSDQLVSWTGYLIEKSHPIHGQRKYYYLHKSETYVPVHIIKDDEFGEKFGVCCVCDERMIWESWCGWRHCSNDMEWVNAQLPSTFKFFVPTHESIELFKAATKKLRQCSQSPQNPSHKNF